MTLLRDNSAAAIFGAPLRRRRRVPWWVLPVIIVIGLALLAGTLRSETREVVLYIDTAQPLMVEQAAIAESFESLVRRDLATIEREDFSTLISRAETSLRDANAELEALDPPDSAAVADELLRLALTSWESGMNDFGLGILEAADEPTSPMPLDRLNEGILDLRLGDAAYELFLAESMELINEVDVDVGEFPAVSFAAGEPTLSSAESLATFVRTSSQLGIRSDVAITSVVFDPPDSGGQTPDGAEIFPVTESLLLQATVSNAGNQAEKGLVLTVTLLDSVGDLIATEQSEQLDLQAGESASVTFTALPVVPGQRYLLLLDLTPTPTELLLDDNRREIDLVISSP
jgi:hypothetical protein